MIYWQRLLVYLVQVLSTEKEREHGIQLTLEQRRMLEELWKIAGSDEREGEGDKEALDLAVLEVSVELIEHSDYEAQNSALIHFCRVLGYDVNAQRWRDPINYTPMLAGMQFCIRLIMLESVLPRDQRDEWMSVRSRSPEEVFREVHDKWLVVGTGTTFNYIHTLLQYGKSIIRGGRGRERVRLSKDKLTVYLDDSAIIIQEFREFIRSLILDAQKIMIEVLLFGDGKWLEGLDLYSMADNPNVSNIEYSFIVELDGGIKEGRRRMMERLRSEPGRWEKWMHSKKGEEGGIEFTEQMVREYERERRRFLEMMMVLIHVTGGQPGRGTELTSLRYVNWIATPRNIFIEDGQVMVVARYHKAQELTGWEKVIPRFLPEDIGRLLVGYLCDVLPFSQVIDGGNAIGMTEGYLWARCERKESDKRKTWGTWELTRALKKETGKRLGIELNTSDYRHVAIEFDRSFVRGLMKGTEEEMEEKNEEEDIHDLQASHNSRVGDAIYGVRADILHALTARSIDSFRDVSWRWHEFLGLKSRKERKRKDIEQGDEERRETMKRVRVTKGHDIQEEVKEAMMGMLGRDAQFKSEWQEAGLHSVIKGESPLVVILPTGGGKSLLFMLPACMARARCSIVVIPFVALVDDMRKRCVDAGIEAVEWRQGCKERAKVIIVSADRAVSKAFRGYAMGLHLEGWLDRIVVDESHLVRVYK
jgi:hypothetical protein